VRPTPATIGLLVYNPQPHSLKSRQSNVLLRTAAGGFVTAATIVRLCEETHGDETRWVAICDDDREVALAAYYSTPGRLKELQHLLPHLVEAWSAGRRSGLRACGL
jgi:hypothetical protein